MQLVGFLCTLARVDQSLIITDNFMPTIPELSRQLENCCFVVFSITKTTLAYLPVYLLICPVHEQTRLDQLGPVSALSITLQVFTIMSNRNVVGK